MFNRRLTMKVIKLLNLKLTNFKGIKEFELNASGEDIKVYGDNATGKTTLFDAFVWLLFNKDSQNKSDFEIKTLVDGKPIHKLNHEVEATLLVDGQELTLKKVYKEKWTKRRGQLKQEFSGHTTDYFINGVPSKKKEFEETIKSIVDEDVFKLLTNPAYFNESIHWKDRRKLLLEIAGDITDEDVIASNKDLAKLLDFLNGNSIEDHKKIIAAKRKEINEELERIPIRIDEIHRNLPDVSSLNKNQITKELDSVLNEIDAKYEQINSIKNGSEVNEIKKQISDIELKIANVKNEHELKEREKTQKLEMRLQEEKSNLSIIQGEVKSLMQQKEMNEARIKDYERQMQLLREQYKESQLQYKQHLELEFEHENSCSCPTCGQDLPEEQIEEAKANFNRNKAELLEKIQNRLDEINKEGKSLKEKVEQIKLENENLQKEIDKITEQGKQKKADIEKLEQKLEEAKSNITPIEENEEYMKLLEEKQALHDEINFLETDMNESIFAIELEIEKLKEKQSELQTELSKLSLAEQSKARIKELEEQERKLAAEFEELEHQLYLTEEFIRTKVDLLEEKINSKFKYARFKLFEQQINGGLKEVCETTYEGVPYSGGLNNAARINVGLDIINTLSKHYGVQAPIFIDNAESVTKLIDIDAQVISLIVSEKDKKLRVERVQETNKEGVA